MPINSFLYPGPTNSNPYVVDNSCRFEDGDSAYMHKTCSSDGNSKTFTISFWQKLGTAFDADRAVISGGADSNNYLVVRNTSSQTLQILETASGSDHTNLITSRLFRDPSAWYNIVIAVDTTQGTASNRVKLYVNGTQETSFSTATYPGEDDDLQFNNNTAHAIGRRQPQANIYMDGYLAEVVFIDGLQLAASSFGEFDADSPTIWKPKNLNPISGLKGTNGFYLDFEDSANLGNDVWGGTDLTEVNLAAADQATDTPTNSFCTLNPLSHRTQSGTVTACTFAEGNNKATHGHGSNVTIAVGTMAVSSGKWYFEAKVDDAGDDANIGVISASADLSGQQGVSGHPSIYYGSNGKKCYNVIASNDGDSFGDTYTDDDIISVALDLDNNVIWFAKNGTWQDSGDPTSGATATGAAFSGTGTSDGFPTTSSFYLPVTVGYNSFIASTNFGGCPAFSISSGNADANGYGNFEYAPPSGFYALCSKNLAEFGG